MDKVEGVKKSENFADVINGCSLSTTAAFLRARSLILLLLYGNKAMGIHRTGADIFLQTQHFGGLIQQLIIILLQKNALLHLHFCLLYVFEPGNLQPKISIGRCERLSMYEIREIRVCCAHMTAHISHKRTRCASASPLGHHPFPGISFRLMPPHNIGGLPDMMSALEGEGGY